MKAKTALKGMKVAKTPEKRREYAEKYKEAKVVEQVLNCTKCNPAYYETTPIPLSGPVANEVKFVAHAPDGWDRKAGAPFSGRGGNLFRSEAIKAGWGQADASLMFQVACWIPDNDGGMSAKACWKNYQAQLGDSWLVVLVGRDAFEHQFPKKEFSHFVANFIWHDQRLWYVLDDLDYYLNHPSMLGSSLITLHRLLEGQQLPIKNPKTFMVSDRDIAKKMKTNKGWVHIWSNVLEKPIIVVKDAYTSAPGRFSDLPQYTLSEIARLRGVGREGWKAVNLVKTELGGTVYR